MPACTPATRRAAELASAMWASCRISSAGVPGVAARQEAGGAGLDRASGSACKARSPEHPRRRRHPPTCVDPIGTGQLAAPLPLVPPAAQQPLAGCEARRRGRHLGRQLAAPADGGQVQAGEGEASRDEVEVGVDEPRRHHCAAKVDNLCPLPLPLLQRLRVGTSCRILRCCVSTCCARDRQSAAAAAHKSEAPSGGIYNIRLGQQRCAVGADAPRPHGGVKVDNQFFGGRGPLLLLLLLLVLLLPLLLLVRGKGGHQIVRRGEALAAAAAKPLHA